MRWPSRRRRKPSHALEGLYDPALDSVVPDPRERVRLALSGISAELAALPWDWRHEWSPLVGPGQVILVDGDPRNVYPNGLEHPTLLGKPRA